MANTSLSNAVEEKSLHFKLNLQAYTLVIALVLIAFIFGLLTKGEFLSSRNLSNLFTQMSVISILSIGMTLVIVAGQIDLSVGSLVGLTGGIAAILQVWFGWSTTMVVITAILVGALAGLWQGWWVAYKNVPAFIVTLGGMLIFRGILIGISKGQTVAPLNHSFTALGTSYVPYVIGSILAVASILLLYIWTYRSRKKRISLGLKVKSAKMEYGRITIYSLLILLLIYMLNRYYGMPVPMLFVIAFAAIFIFISVKTPFGRYIYAIGGNAEAAALSGINIKKTILIIFILMGALAGVAGIILTGRLNAATTGAGDMYELDAIAACVIGGTSLMGGKGNIIGAIIGALIMTSIDNGMSMMNIETFWQYIVKGLILIIAVWIDMAGKKNVAA
ncbi:sugar ABC transporter permease [Tuberibacillus calidus]|uniref:sugar ABC transporter permease n=1 Tax=Tuberibacillus calidus TaxID=340097 RepID=UPI000412E1C0|nr:sugar ABC transporter permease [Tuberibacillus calidus]